MQLRDKVILLTGATGGLGAALAAEFRTCGAKLVLTGRDAVKLAAHATPGDAIIPGDLCDETFRARLIDECVQRHGRIDVLVNNAGIGLYASTDRAAMPLVRRMFELNFFAPLDLAQRAIPFMRAQGGGTIVNISSIAGRLTLPWFTLYSASKFALCSFTEGVRMEFSHEGIHAMLVLPGYIHTAFQDNVLGGTPPESIRKAKRFAVTPEECAREVVAGLERGARTVVTPFSGKLLMALARRMPGVVESRLAGANREANRRS